MAGSAGYGANAFLNGFMQAWDHIDAMHARDEQLRAQAEDRQYQRQRDAAGTWSAPVEGLDPATGKKGYFSVNNTTGGVRGLSGIAPAPDKPKYGIASYEDNGKKITRVTADGLPVGDPIATSAAGQSSSTPYYLPLTTSGGVYTFDARTGAARPLQSSEGKPLLPPAVDPTVQGAVSEAKSAGTVRGKYAGSQPKVYASLNAASAKTDRVVDAIDKALGMVDGMTTGVTGTVLSHVPGTEAKNLQRTLDAVRANIGFNELQDMRSNSPTGGALGQVSEQENTLLQSVLGSLSQDQSPQQLRENLMKAKAALLDSRARLQQAYQTDFGDGSVALSAAPAATAPAASPSAASGLEGRTATNPKTGQTIVYRNGKWEPAQ